MWLNSAGDGFSGTLEIQTCYRRRGTTRGSPTDGRGELSSLLKGRSVCKYRRLELAISTRSFSVLRGLVWLLLSGCRRHLGLLRLRLPRWAHLSPGDVSANRRRGEYWGGRAC